MDSFLLIGQSNMAGRGYIDQVPAILNERIKVLTNGRWQTMTEPIHNDRQSAGVGLAASFAGAWCANNTSNDEIGLIPCAEGGASLEEWMPGSLLFDHMIAQTKLALRTSTLKGILWHQGESDASTVLAGLYQDKFERFVKGLRLALGNTEVPLIIGGLGDFLSKGMYGQYFSSFHEINRALLEYTNLDENSFFVSTEGLTANQDHIHFNAKSLRTFGIRYFQAFHKKMNIVSSAEDDQILEIIYNRALNNSEKAFVLQYQFAIGEISPALFQEHMEKLKEA